ncbi:ethylene receptor 1-like [Bidens hawaiensis]|uniref:ethylene receptor 1-like n=1 Tax=Bidens hawaiensis TaxID=980011 RepID=UPI0040498E20
MIKQETAHIPFTSCWLLKAFMDVCYFLVTQWPAADTLTNYQYISDFFISLAYFLIPLELIYFVLKSAYCPYRWILVQFGVFIVLCGSTHIINLWTFSEHSKTVAMVLTVAKFMTALISCITALMLVRIIPKLLNKKDETGRRVRKLTRKIQRTLDHDTIVKTAMIELGKMFDLSECALWMPNGDHVMEVSHSLHGLIPVGSTIRKNSSEVRQVFNSPGALRVDGLSSFCPWARSGRVVVVRIPLRKLYLFESDNWVDFCYAIMVLVLPVNGLRKWRDHELELVEVVVDQVDVALSHAAVVEESMRDCEELIERNVALESALWDMEVALAAQNDYVGVINYEMRRPTQTGMALSSLQFRTELSPEQRFMTHTVLGSSSLLAQLTNIIELSRLEYGIQQFEIVVFDIRELFREVLSPLKFSASQVVDLMHPVVWARSISMTVTLDENLPKYVIGDRKWLMRTIMNVVDNAVKFTIEGYVKIEASILSSELVRGWQTREFHPIVTDDLFYLLVKVEDSGIGIAQQELPYVFTKYLHPGNDSMINNGAGLGLTVCRRFVNMTDGHIWVESDGLEEGTTVTFFVSLGHCVTPDDPTHRQ